MRRWARALGRALARALARALGRACAADRTDVRQLWNVAIDSYTPTGTIGVSRMDTFHVYIDWT